MSASAPRARVEDPLRSLAPTEIRRNENNPRRYFNDEALDLLRTSIQEVGILVPLIVYEDPDEAGAYTLMDGERRWTSAVDLGMKVVPANVIPVPSPLSNLLQMFNIHSVREEWPLISVALSLNEVIQLSGEDRESRLAEMTGLTRSTVRRAKRLLSLPKHELELISKDAHLDRSKQVHREDLYLEIEAAVSVIRNELPEIAKDYTRPAMIRAFVSKREQGTLRAVTEFRNVGKLVKAGEGGLVGRAAVLRAVRRLVDDVEATPSEVFNQVAAGAYGQREIWHRTERLTNSLAELDDPSSIPTTLRKALQALRGEINRLIGQ